jgi:hypothetical protein
MGQDALLQRRRIRYVGNEAIDGFRVERIVHENIRALRKRDEILRRPSIAGDHDRSIFRVEAITERRHDGWVIHQRRANSHVLVFEDDAALHQLVNMD